MTGMSFKKAREIKLAQRDASISKLPSKFHVPLDNIEQDIATAPVSRIIQQVQEKKVWSSEQVLTAFAKTAIAAQAQTNCLTEIFIDQADQDAVALDAKLKQTGEPVGPLHGIPVSLKDTFNVVGQDSTLGYSSYVGKTANEDGVLVKLLRGAGAIPYVKTNVPQTLLLAESVNPLFGAVDHPTHPGYTPGGSSGGESALLALNGSVLGLGTDIGGSLRIPAAFAGICSLKPSVGRISRGKNTSTNPGIETVSSVVGPMTRTVDDLEYFTKVLLNLKAWELDQTVLPLPYREEETKLPAKLRIGYYTDIGLVDSSPACKRAVLQTVEALRAAGHDVFEFTVPDMPQAASLGSSLLTADKGKTICLPIKKDPLVAGVKAMLKFYHLPWWMKKLQIWMLRTFAKDNKTADYIENMKGAKDVFELWQLTAERERYRQKFMDLWNASANPSTGQAMDCIICPVNALPTMKHNKYHECTPGISYTVLYNLLDYSAGVLPVTKVSAQDDFVDRASLMKNTWNSMEKGMFAHYNVQEMQGLPVPVQVVGRRLQEEKVIAMMQVIKKVLNESGKPELQMRR